MNVNLTSWEDYKDLLEVYGFTLEPDGTIVIESHNQIKVSRM